MIRTRERSRGDSGAWYSAGSLALNGVSPTYISQFDKDRYYSSTAGVRPFPYTFSRASNAMQFDSAGRLVWAKANMLLHSDDLTNAAWAKTDSTITANTETAPSGASADLVTEGVAGTALVQQVVGSMPAYAQFTYSVEMKRGNHDWVRIYFGSGSGNNQTWFNLATGAVGTTTMTTAVNPQAATMVDLGGGWYRLTLSVADVNMTSVTLLTVSAASDGSTTRVNNATRTEGRHQFEMWGPDCPKLPLTQTTASASYSQRLDYNPNGNTARGLLLERAATNLCPISGETAVRMPAATGGFYHVGPSARVFDREPVVFQGGGASAAMFVPFGTLAAAPAASTQYAASVFVKAGTRTKCQLTVSSSFAAVDCYANFDLSNGAVLANGAGASNILATNCGNGVWRLSFAFTTRAVPAAGAAVVVSYIETDTDTRIPTITSSLSDTLIVYGAQLELGAGPTSYIPTFAASATRAVETATETLGAWFDATKGTMYSHIEIENQTLATFPNSFWIHDGTANNRLSQYFSAASGAGVFEVRSGAVTSATISVAGTFIGVHKLASRWNTTGTVSQSSRDGTAGTQDNTTTVPTVTTLSVGGNAASTEPLNGWVREVRYYPDASASDAQLNALTA